MLPHKNRGLGVDDRRSSGPVKTLNKYTKRRVSKVCRLIEASESNNIKIGYLCNWMVWGLFPNRRLDASHFSREYRGRKTTLFADASIGLPYGFWPRAIIVWICTEFVRKGTQHIDLGHSMSSFLRELRRPSSGGPRGSYKNLRSQVEKLLLSTITYYPKYSSGKYKNQLPPTQRSTAFFHVAENGKNFMDSTLVLAEGLFQSLQTDPVVPLNFETYLFLGTSPLAMDLYALLTYKVACKKHPFDLSWDELMAHTGSTNNHPGSFRRACKHALCTIQIVYTGLRCTPTKSGFHIERSEPHVKRQKRTNNPVYF